MSNMIIESEVSNDILLPIEMIDLIFDNVTCAKTFKVILQLSKYTNVTHKYKKYNKNYCYCNLLWTLIKKYPNEDWYWCAVMRNPNTTIPLFKENSERYEDFSCNPNLTICFLNENLDKKWNWDFVSSNPGITMQDIDDNPTLSWSWDMGVAYNPNITIDYIEKNIGKFNARTIYGTVSGSPKITMQDIESHPQYAWDYNRITINPNLTIDFVKKYAHRFDEYNDFPEISFNPNITLKNIMDNPQLPWDYPNVLCNPNVTMDMLEDPIVWKWLQDKFEKFGDNWNAWDAIMNNPNLTLQFVNNHPEINWDWEAVFRYAHITEEMIDELYRKGLCVDFTGLSLNNYGK